MPSPTAYSDSRASQSNCRDSPDATGWGASYFQCVPEFLVERYVSRLDAAALAAIAAESERAATELATTGLVIRWLRSVGVLEEETCFCFFTAPAVDDVIAANERAGVGYERVAEVLSLEHSEAAGLPDAAAPAGGSAAIRTK